jgi:hypothetical protein
MTDFVNVKIKSTWYFKSAYRGRMCVYVFIRVNDHTCISTCVCTMFLKKISNDIAL